MTTMKYFDKLHPITAFVYFMLILLVAMLTMNPIIITICYLASVVFFGMLIGWSKLLCSLAYSIPVMMMIAFTNPLFVHKGETVLFFLNGNPITKESIIYGVFSSMMIMSVFYLCRSYTRIITTDKFIYLFGRVIPKLSLVLSMTLAFIPKLKRKYQEIDDAQKALGIYASESYMDKIRSKMRVLSILFTNNLETSVDTADSMRARGYGLKGRTSYTIYRFTASDFAYLAFSILFGGSTVVLIMLGASEFNYYPTITTLSVSPLVYILYSTLVLLAGSSIFLEVKEDILWRYLKSKI